MPQVFIGVGSNIEREKNICSAIKIMRERFGTLLTSPVYESKAFGFVGENFYNLVVGLETELGPGELNESLRNIESMFRRKWDEPRFAPRTLDLDLLLYDDLVCDEKHLQIPREDVTKYAFVLKPLADIAGDLTHPVTHQQYSDLWNSFDNHEQKVWPVDIDIEA